MKQETGWTAMASEVMLTRELTKVFRSQGAMVYAAVAGTHGQSGWPDRWVGWHGKQWWLEMKFSGNKLTAIQRRVLLNIQDTGACVWVIELLPGRLAHVVDIDGTVISSNVPWKRLLNILKELT